MYHFLEQCFFTLMLRGFSFQIIDMLSGFRLMLFLLAASGIINNQTLRYFILFFVRPLVPTHCRCSGLLLHLITLNDTHTLGKTLLVKG